MCEHKAADNRDLLGLLDAAAELLRAAGRLPLSGAVSDVGLTQAMQKLEAIGRICAGQKSTLIGEITGREAHRGQAAGSTADLLARTLHLTRGEVRGHTELAAGLALVPETAAALRDGRLGVEQARVTVRKAEEVKGRDDAEELLAKIDATGATVGQTLDKQRLAREIDTAVARTGADVLADRERRAHERRNVTWDVRDGMTVLRAELDPLAGAQVRAKLDGLSGKTDEADKRSFPQRQADALVLLASRANELAGELPGVGKITSDVLLITTPEALHGLPGAEPSLLDGHGPVSTGLARQMCCDARVTAVTTDRDGKILDVGRSHRTATPAQRAAVIARDKQCVGCGAPVTRCQVHHIIWWRNGGDTDLANLLLVCWNCHHHIHNHGWLVTKRGGKYHAGPPGDPDHDPASPHLDNSIEQTPRALVHTS